MRPVDAGRGGRWNAVRAQGGSFAVGGTQVQGTPSFAPSCPHCSGADVRRSRRRRLEWLALPLPLRPYRCLRCGCRFWRLGWWLRAPDGDPHRPQPAVPAPDWPAHARPAPAPCPPAPRESHGLLPSRAARLFEALGSPARVRLLLLLAERREAGVDDLCAALGLPRAGARGHLRVLRGFRLVKGRRDRQHVLYRLASPAVADLVRLACGHRAAGAGRGYTPGSTRPGVGAASVEGGGGRHGGRPASPEAAPGVSCTGPAPQGTGRVAMALLGGRIVATLPPREYPQPMEPQPWPQGRPSGKDRFQGRGKPP
jgi:ArsR family transcriptional regulator